MKTMRDVNQAMRGLSGRLAAERTGTMRVGLDALLVLLNDQIARDVGCASEEVSGLPEETELSEKAAAILSVFGLMVEYMMLHHEPVPFFSTDAILPGLVFSYDPRRDVVYRLKQAGGAVKVPLRRLGRNGESQFIEALSRIDQLSSRV